MPTTDTHYAGATKPPKGEIPKDLWLEMRIGELARAIHEYTWQGSYPKQLEDWIGELRDVYHERFTGKSF